MTLRISRMDERRMRDLMGYSFEKANEIARKEGIEAAQQYARQFRQYESQGDCDCGKKDVNLLIIHGPEEVTLEFYNRTTKTGKTFALGSECVKTVTRA